MTVASLEMSDEPVLYLQPPFNSKLYNKCEEDEKKRGELSSNYSKKYADLWYESKSEEN